MDIALKDNDIFLNGNNDLAVVSDEAQLTQAILIYVRMFLTDYAFDNRVGISWVQVFIDQMDQLDLLTELETKLKQVKGVSSVQVELKQEDRMGILRFTVNKNIVFEVSE